MKVATLFVGFMLIVSSGLLVADDHHVVFDRSTDFSAFKTFGMREGKITSQRPELNNPLFAKKVTDAIRSELKAKGLKDTANSPDILVEFSIVGTSYTTTERGQRTVFEAIPPSRRNTVIETGPRDIRISEAELVIDLKKRDPNVLIWRGVYRDQEDNDSKLAKKLPEDVKKLFSEYPRKK